MGGIEDIEKLLQAVFARLAVINKKQGQGKEAQILQIQEGGIGVVDAQGDQSHRECGQPMGFFLEGAHPHGQKDSEKSVIHRDVMAQKSGTNHGHGEGDEPDGAIAALTESRLCPTEQRHQAKGDREGDENSQFKGVSHHRIGDLAGHAQKEYAQKIFQAVFGVIKSLADEVGKQGERQPSHGTHPYLGGEQKQSRVINEHTNCSQKF